MASTLPERAPARQLNRLEHLSPSMAKADLKKVEVAWKEQIGAAIARAIALAGLTRKEAAGALDKDEATIARWVSGLERPMFDAMWAVPVLRRPLIQALAEMADDVIVETVVRMRRQR
jgi:hypothetical protein